MVSAVRETKQTSAFHRQLALAGILGPLMFGLVPLALASSLPGYNAVKDTLSALALTPHGWIQTLDFCLFGLFVILFAWGLYAGIARRRGLKLSLVLLILSGIGVLLIGIIPTDPAPVMTLRGLVHKQIVYAVGLLFPAACYTMLPSLKNDPNWRGLAPYTAITGSLVFVFIVGWIYLNASGLVSSILGLYERIFTWNATIWVEIMAVRLLFLPHIEPAVRRNLSRVPRYVIVGASLLMAFSGFQIRKQRRIGRKISTSSIINPLLFIGAKSLGDRFGLKPLTSVALNLVKNE